MNSPIPSDCTRRRFLSILATTAAVPLIAADAAPKKKKKSSGDAAAVTGPAPHREPTTIHVFAKPLQWLSYADTARLLAETGYGGIDYAVRPGGHVLPEKVQEDLPRAVEAARQAGLKVEMITTAITDPRDPHTTAIVKTAAQLGIKYYRLGTFRYDEKLGVAGTLQNLKSVFKDLADLNQAHGIHGALQNHAGPQVGAALWDTYELVKDLDPRWLGIQYDIRHATAEGGQSWPVVLKLIHRWIRTTDIKDFKWQQSPGRATIENVPLGGGIVPFDQYFKLVRDLGISGPMSVHFEYPPFERSTKPMSDAEKRKEFVGYLKHDLQALKGYMAKQQLA